jgi:hypothetical protein
MNFAVSLLIALLATVTAPEPRAHGHCPLQRAARQELIRIAAFDRTVATGLAYVRVHLKRATDGSPSARRVIADVQGSERFFISGRRKLLGRTVVAHEPP